MNSKQTIARETRSINIGFDFSAGWMWIDAPRDDIKKAINRRTRQAQVRFRGVS
jgi:hypothetical protein